MKRWQSEKLSKSTQNGDYERAFREFMRLPKKDTSAQKWIKKYIIEKQKKGLLTKVGVNNESKNLYSINSKI